MHGAGVIEAVEEKEILSHREPCYVMRLLLDEMRVTIPLRSTEDIGLRMVISRDEVPLVLTVLKTQDEVDRPQQNWNRRYRANLEKIKSGSIYQVAEVVRTLARRDKEKGLSTGERRMLDSARQILLSELILSEGIEAAEAQRLLDEPLAE
jgi:CarD family transcriptional regulator